MKTESDNNLSVFERSNQKFIFILHVLIILISLSTSKSEKHSFANTSINYNPPTYPLPNSHHLRSLRKQQRDIQVPNDTFQSDFLKRRQHYPQIVNKITREEPPGSTIYLDTNTDCLMLCKDDGCQRGEPRKPPGSGQNVNYGRRSATNLKHFQSTRPYNNDDDSADCLHAVRKTVRFVPGDCYSKKFEYRPADNAKNITSFHNTWWNFAAEILGDLMYTFDFVLWGKGSEETNQFWYLILYLKELAMTYSNPSEIVSKASNEAYLVQLNDKLEEAKKKLKKRQEDHKILDYTLKQLKIVFASHVQVMEDLRDKIKKVSIPTDKSNEEKADEAKLDELTRTANELEQIFRRSNFRDLSIKLDKEIEILHEQSDKKHNMDAVSDGENSDLEKKTNSKNFAG